MDRDAVRAFALRDRSAVAALRQAYWADRHRREGAVAAVQASLALRDHVRSIRPDWPDAADRARDLEHHAAFSRLLARVADALAAR